jgi:hypothetical protein
MQAILEAAFELVRLDTDTTAFSGNRFDHPETVKEFDPM